MQLIKIIIPSLLLGACVFGTSKNAKFFAPSVISTQVVSATYASPVGIDRVQLPKYIDRPQMVTHRKDSAQINISEFNRWVEAPTVLTTRVLTENLSVLLPAAQIRTNTSKGEQFDKIVSVEVIEMNAILGDKAELVAWYTIKNSSKQVLIQQKFTDTVQLGKTYDDLAQGYGQLLDKLSREIAENLIKK